MATAGESRGSLEATDDRRLESIRRFSRAEIALHWAVVVPYLVLGTTGTVMLGAKHAAVLAPARPILVTLHLGAGVALVALPLVVLIASAPGPLARSALEALRFGPTDIWWLHASALRLVFPRMPRPKEGRFNAGQKINVLHVLLLVPALALSGVALWLHEAALLVRVIHVSGAAVSLLIASGHVYLALIHPGTRSARGAMFHGSVPAFYAARHHPRWYEALTALDAPREQARGPLISTLAIVIVAGVLLSTLALITAAAYGARKNAVTRTWRQARELAALHAREPRRILLPGPLAPVHRSVNDLEYCSACHGGFLHGSIDARCLGCHDEIGARIESGVGYHGRLTGHCGDCHRDHHDTLVELDERSFQHDQALFRLDGAHRSIDCDGCHVSRGDRKRRFLGIEHDSCEACHEDPHARPGSECSKCHDHARSWAAGGFDHSRDARFVLDARHEGLPCSACHLAGVVPRFRVAADDDSEAESAFTCETCHDDVVGVLAGVVGPALAPEWLTPSVHDGELSCAECHASAPLTGNSPLDSLTRRCSDCHSEDYDALSIEWQAKIEIELIGVEPTAAAAWRSQAVHHWEAVLEALRRR